MMEDDPKKSLSTPKPGKGNKSSKAVDESRPKNTPRKNKSEEELMVDESSKDKTGGGSKDADS